MKTDSKPGGWFGRFGNSAKRTKLALKTSYFSELAGEKHRDLPFELPYECSFFDSRCTTAGRRIGCCEAGTAAGIRRNVWRESEMERNEIYFRGL